MEHRGKSNMNEITLIQLNSYLENWFQRFSPHTFCTKVRFKHDCDQVNIASASLLKKIIIYVYCKLFWKDLHQSDMEGISEYNCDMRAISEYSCDIRQFYLTNNLLKKDNQDKQFKFWMLIVFFTKVVSSFLEECFTQIQINQQLEAKVFIILVFVIAGIKVSPKSYSIISNKYIFQSNLTYYNSPNKQFKLRPTHSFQTASSKYQPKRIRNQRKKSQKSISILRMDSKKVDKHQEFNDQSQFRNLLTKQLSINKKIKITKKRFNINQIEMDREINLKDDLLITKNHFLKRNKFINSSEITSALKTCYVTQSNNNSKHHTKLKHHPLQLFKDSNHKFTCSLTNNLENDVDILKVQDINETKRDWKHIISNLKHKNKHIDKLNQSLYQTNDGLSQAFPQRYILSKIGQDFDGFQEHNQLTHQDQRIKTAHAESQLSLLKVNTNTNDHIQCIMNDLSMPLISRAKYKENLNHRKNGLHSHHLRMNRAVFYNDCQERQSKTSSSIFNLPLPLTL